MLRNRLVRQSGLRLWLAFVATVSLAALVGCDPSAGNVGSTSSVTGSSSKAGQPESAREASGEQSVAATLPALPEPPDDDLDGGQLVEETWDAYSMQAARVGYSRTRIANVVEEGRPLVRTSNYTYTSMQRGGQTVNQALTMTSWDTPDGQLVRFETRMSSGPGEIASVGAVRDGKLGIDTTTLGRTQSQTIPWQADWGGLFAPDQSLRRSSMKPGEKRSIRSLVPIFNIPGETHLEALDYEPVETLLPLGEGGRRPGEGVSTRSASEGSGSTVKLLKIKTTLAIGPQTIEQFIWIDDHGETLKSLVPSLGQEAVRTSKADALQPSGGAKYDLLSASSVPLDGTLPDPPHTKRAVYRAHLTSGKIAGLFSDCLSQRVEPIDEQTAQLTVLAVRPNSVAGTLRVPSALNDNEANGTRNVPTTLPPTDADRASNNFIQADDRQIVEMARRIAADEKDTWQIACALERFVADAVQNKTFSQAFATAAEVARSLEGDCTEHAVLLAALCRARQIPARVAFGLVYYPPERGFAYHMWNEVWIKDRWVPLDATLGLGGIGADHIKLGDSNLSGGSPMADLLAVIQVFGRLKLTLVNAE